MPAAPANATFSAQEITRTLGALPPLPAVAMRVMQVAQDPRSSASDLAVVVSADPGLTTAMLKVANSAAYRRTREVASVQEALVVLGFVQARNIAIGGAIAGRYAPNPSNALFRISEFWRHSIAVGFRAGDLATNVPGLDVPSAFTAGIVHNIGRLAVFYADPAGLDQAVAEAMRRDIPLEDAERELLGFDHADLGQRLAVKWQLPAVIAEAIGAHHGAGAPGTLGQVVAEADEFCLVNGLYPGYFVPGKRPKTTDIEFGRLMMRVDSLMELVNGNPVGVRRAN